LGKESALSTFESKTPKSALMGIFLLRQTDTKIMNEPFTMPVDETYVPAAVEDVYDDNDPAITNDVTFENSVARLLSNKVQTRIYTKVLEDIWGNMVMMGIGGRLLFEVYIHALVKQNQPTLHFTVDVPLRMLHKQATLPYLVLKVYVWLSTRWKLLSMIQGMTESCTTRQTRCMG
jgi:hypothetical protein